ncbi:MAG: hypothetical protein GWM88_18505 [Pseudomonadales bacterium]|nr:hypothetical protein [Pseudomonadales bacterium]NIX09916.1 hypothetical protein [Pseudomonadales bacterium]
MTVDAQRLPDGFAVLEPYCDRWCLPDSGSRNQARIEAAMDDIRDFYDAMIPLAGPALDHLSGYQLGDLEAGEANLLRLLLSLAEVGPAVEWFGQPRVIDGYPESKFPLVLALDDLAAQR